VYHLLLEPPEQLAQQLWRHDSDGVREAQQLQQQQQRLQQQQQQRLQQQQQQHRQQEQQSNTAREGSARAAGEQQEGEGQGEQQRLLPPARPEGGSTGDAHQQLEQPQQQQGSQQPDVDIDSSSWKPSKAGRMTWQERLYRTGAQGRAGRGMSSAAPCGLPHQPALLHLLSRLARLGGS
jgi:hypothetical protein